MNTSTNLGQSISLALLLILTSIGVILLMSLVGS